MPEDVTPAGEEDLEEEADLELDDAEIDDAEIDTDEEFEDDVDLVEDEVDVPDDDLVVADDEEEVEAAPPAKPASEEDSEEDDLEEVDPDDVEADLDTILKDRIAAADDDEEDEEEPPDTDDRADGNRIQPRRPGEFVCRSCFLVKPHTQLADATLQLCADCV
ncbi:MAG: DUF4193 family protein [Acidimicrobiia bacterium]